MADFYFIHLILSILMMEEEKGFNYRFSISSHRLHGACVSVSVCLARQTAN